MGCHQMNGEQSNPARARVDLETVIRRLHCSRIGAGLHTFDMGIFVWISDRLHRIRCERVFKQSQEGPAWEDDSAALWLHDAALRLFPGSPFCVLNARPSTCRSTRWLSLSMDRRAGPTQSGSVDWVKHA